MNTHGSYYDALVGQSCMKWSNSFMLVRIQFLQIHPYLLEGMPVTEHCVRMGLTYVKLLLGPLAHELCCTLPDC